MEDWSQIFNGLFVSSVLFKDIKNDCFLRRVRLILDSIFVVYAPCFETTYQLRNRKVTCLLISKQQHIRLLQSNLLAELEMWSNK